MKPFLHVEPRAQPGTHRPRAFLTTGAANQNDTHAGTSVMPTDS